ncbi:Dor1-like family protein [Dictyocaulus viviparus]|uniref:Conserved oligomeric Golgi complex subunit 8 n=1 Tax=Dictyocaulus viviparus TaxID=29172 RepID=A0A0D8XF58_DICVI|nr:Dor1-like family protein [Dictyocaulus viviparus]
MAIRTAPSSSLDGYIGCTSAQTGLSRYKVDELISSLFAIIRCCQVFSCSFKDNMDSPSVFMIECELKAMGLEQLKMKDMLRVISDDVPQLAEELRCFHVGTKNIINELDVLKSSCQKDAAIWELLSLPSRMDVCIRAGYYEAAYSLTNYGIILQQHSVLKNPLVKLCLFEILENIADKLVEARSFLLEELFNKFSGPLDLASSIQVVNNVRKMPNLTSAQLRLCILQHRDIYLNRQVLEVTSHPEFAVRIIEIYRDYMYDTLVLYLAIFPENELPRKDPSLDLRWETWPVSVPSVVLGQWAARNIIKLLDLVRRADIRNGVDICTVWSKLMSLAVSLGRMGLDFRALVVDSLTKILLERFHSSVRAITNNFVNDTKVLSIVNEELSSHLLARDISSDDPPLPPPEISVWDDICIYGNGVLDALNGLRHSPSPMLLESVMACVRDSLRCVLLWLLRHASTIQFAKAVEILFLYFGPFIERCIRYIFPFSNITRLFGTSISPETYESLTELSMLEIVSSCDGSEVIHEILRQHSSEMLLSNVNTSHVTSEKDVVVENMPEITGTLFVQQEDTTVEHSNQMDTITEFSDTVMSSSSRPTSTAINSELCNQGGQVLDSENLSENDERISPSNQSHLHSTDTIILVSTEGNNPALIDTAPTPSHDQKNTAYGNDFITDQQRIENESCSEDVRDSSNL